MARKSTPIKIDTSDAKRQLQDLEVYIAKVEQELKQLGNALNASSSVGSQAQFFSGMQNLQAARGALATAQSSAVFGSTSPAALQAGAAAALSGLGIGVRNQRVSGDAGAQYGALAQGLGLPAAAMVAIAGQVNSGSVPLVAGNNPLALSGSAATAAASAAIGLPFALRGASWNAPFSVMPGSAAPGGYSQIGVGAALNTSNPGLNYAAMAVASQQIYRTGFALGGSAAYAGVQFATGQIDYATERIRHGGVDYQAQGGMIGRGIGTVVGGLLGALTGTPAGVIGGAAIGGQLFDAAGRYFTAHAQNAADATQSNIPIHVLGGGGGYWRQGMGSELRDASGPARAARFNLMAGDINRTQVGIGSQALNVTGPQLANAYTDVASSLYSGGRNPFEKDTAGVFYGDRDRNRAQQNFRDRYTGGLKGVLQGIVDLATGHANEEIDKLYGRGQSNIADTYTRRLGMLFGNQIDVGVKQVAPIFGSMPETGGNVADILQRFGPQNTFSYLRIQNDALQSPISSTTLRTVSAGVREQGRLGQLGALQPTGSAAAVAAAFQGQMQEFAQLPDGKNSLAYAQAYSGYRSSRYQAWGQEDLSGYGLEAQRLSGYRERLSVMPFAPGNIFGANLSSIALNTRQLGVIRGRLKTGDLSEQERYSLEGQEQSLMTQNAHGIAELSEGWENRLPGMHAGRTPFFGRYNSTQLAAMSLYRRGSPIRAFGSVNGRQAQQQDAFITSVVGDGGGAGIHSPYSRTADLNQTNQLLSRILQALERNGGSRVGNSRPSDAYGNASGALASRDLGAEKLYNRH